MALTVFWSDRLELLAEQLFKGWEETPVRDPFARVCVVVGDMATRNWLHSFFLLHRRPGARRILANIDFTPLPELVNDWLAAMCGKDGEQRNPSEHPYAKNVLAWRINAILKDQAQNPDLAVPLAYVRRAKDSVADRRRFELATRLAELFDDYLGARYQMLATWEAGKLPPGAERWQAALYRLLAQEAPGTYTRDYARALGAGADPQTAFANGFPRYTAIHVFDVAFAPWPYLQMLRKMSAAVPTTFWNFNPSRDYWLDDATKKQAQREWARTVLAALQNGDTPPEATPENMFETPSARLLGALGSGARGMLAAQLDLAEGDCDWVGKAHAETFAALRNLVPEVHVCHSPRRELEAARDALHRFFDEVPDARPSDALVLCADWGTYAPLVPSVFGVGGGESVPFALDGGVQETTPVTHSLEELLAFRSNRFEASAVFSLLGVPSIRARFGIDADGLSVLREMVRGNNIHWGYDDADVNGILGTAGANHPFTWRRGLDRFIADALIGPREDPEALVAVGGLGRLRPCGSVEAERARLVGALVAFVTALANLRVFLQKPHSIETWRARLVAAIDDFYLGDDETNEELAGLRGAVMSATGDALIARMVGQASSKNAPVPGDVMCAAVLAAVNAGVRRVSSSGDVVRVAPLMIGTAVPARFVWICGLSDGVFPRAEHRPAFDLIGRHPTLFDATVRERDALALLKAAMGARERLALSYVGRNVRSNEEMPPAVPLTDLIEWFAASKLVVKTYRHPLQAYSPRYFTAAETPERTLPPSYSAANHDAAVALAGERDDVEATLEVAPFAYAADGDTVIEVDDLAAFYSRPSHFLARNRMGVRLSKPGYDNLEDEDSLVADLPRDLERTLLLRGADAVDVDEEAERLVESGITMDSAELAIAMKGKGEAGEEYRSRRLKYKKAESDGFTCADDKTAAGAFVEWEDGAELVPYHVELNVDGRRVILTGCRHEIKLDVLPKGQLGHVFAFSDYATIYTSTKIGAWVRHVAGHAAGGDGFVTAMMCKKDGPVRTYRPLPQAEARKILARLVAQAMKPLPFKFVAALNGDDELPPDFAEALGDYDGRIVSSHGR